MGLQVYVQPLMLILIEVDSPLFEVNAFVVLYDV
jgi:hypothetical protein